MVHVASDVMRPEADPKRALSTALSSRAEAIEVRQRDLVRDLELVLSGQEPEYAKPAVDLSTISSAVSAGAQEPIAIVRKDDPKPFASLPAIILIGVLAVGNIVLLAVALLR